jgi:hypothetical protein
LILRVYAFITIILRVGILTDMGGKVKGLLRGWQEKRTHFFPSLGLTGVAGIFASKKVVRFLMSASLEKSRFAGN